MEHSFVITLFIMLLSGEICSCACPNPRGICKKDTKPEEHGVPLLPLWIRKVEEKMFLNAGLFIRFLSLQILWACGGASSANAAEGSYFPACAICHILEILGRLEIAALFQNALRVRPCEVRGVGKHKEGGAVGMFHVIVSLGKCLWCVVGMYCCNQEQ